MLPEKAIKFKVMTDWYALDYIAFGDEAKNVIGLDRHLVDWNEAKKLALEEAYMHMLVSENVSLSKASTVLEAKVKKMQKKTKAAGKTTAKRQAKKVAKAKAQKAKKAARQTVKKKQKTARKMSKKMARKLKESLKLSVDNASKIAVQLTIVEEAFKHLLGPYTEGIIDLLETLVKIYATNPELVDTVSQ